MQPGIAELLAGIREILERVIAPGLDDPYRATQLRGVGETLAALESRWPRELPRLMRENDEFAALLSDARPVLANLSGAPPDDERAAAVSPPEDPSAYPDLARLEARNRELRRLVSETIRALHAAPPDPERDALRTRIRNLLAATLRRRAGD
ncbi:MAG: hypothetical protein J4G09_12965 [Proteobacteria bacterium]|nr:hypothetical protein [Pseudomonadota bacterium]